MKLSVVVGSDGGIIQWPGVQAAPTIKSVIHLGQSFRFGGVLLASSVQLRNPCNDMFDWCGELHSALVDFFLGTRRSN